MMLSQRGNVVALKSFNQDDFICFSFIALHFFAFYCIVLLSQEVCKHVGALLHHIASEVRKGQNKTCTSLPQTWGHPSVGARKKYGPIVKRDIFLDTFSPTTCSYKLLIECIILYGK